MKPFLWARILALLPPLLFCSCGYHAPGSISYLPDEIKTVYIEAFNNQTFEPFLEVGVTDRVIAEFAHGQLLEVIDEASRADARLSGEVAAYRDRPIAYDRDDRVIEYRAEITVAAELRQTRDGRVLWKGEVTWSQEYPGAFDKGRQELNEAAAIEALSERVAEELYARVVEGF